MVEILIHKYHPANYTDDSPGANDNASGMAGTIEAAGTFKIHL